jgi:hypothetical protein
MTLYRRLKMSYNKLVENESFRLVDPSDPQKPYIVEISEGEFEGVRYSYGVVEFYIEDKDTEDEKAVLKFGVTPEDPKLTHLEENPNFIQATGDILMSILENALETGDYNIGTPEDVSDTEE